MNETGTSFSTYTRVYKEQWRGLMELHDGKHMPLRSYVNGSVAMIWMKSLLYGLLAAGPQKSAVTAEQILAWLGDSHDVPRPVCDL